MEFSQIFIFIFTFGCEIHWWLNNPNDICKFMVYNIYLHLFTLLDVKYIGD